MIQLFLTGITNGTILNKGNRYKIDTIKVYNNLIRSYKAVQDYYKNRYTIEDVTNQLAKKWTEYLHLELKDKKPSSLSKLGKQHKHFKTAIKHNIEKIENLNYELSKKI